MRKTRGRSGILQSRGQRLSVPGKGCWRDICGSWERDRHSLRYPEPPDAGKSTLMGALAVRLREAGKEVLPVFCGSTMLCNDAMDIIRYLVYVMEERLGMEHFEIGKRCRWREAAACGSGWEGCAQG